MWVGKDVTDRIYEGACARASIIPHTSRLSINMYLSLHSMIRNTGYSWRVGAIARWWYATKVIQTNPSNNSMCVSTPFQFNAPNH